MIIRAAFEEVNCRFVPPEGALGRCADDGQRAAVIKWNWSLVEVSNNFLITA